MNGGRKPHNGKAEIEDGYLKIANELVDQFTALKITATQWNILFLVMRETYGYNRKSKDLAVSYVAKAIGVSDFSTGKAIQDLIHRRILIEYIGHTPRKSRCVGMNKYYTEWICPQAKLGSAPKDDWGLAPKDACPKQRQYKDTYKDKGYTARPQINHQSVLDDYNETCSNLPRCMKLSDSRRRAISARLKTYTREELHSIFEQAQNSGFLTGNNDRKWCASFDWLMKDANMAKVLDGNYADKPRRDEDGKDQYDKIFEKYIVR